jgi:hypothetical protein
MNKKINWIKRGRTNVAGVGIPVRFYVDATGFDVTIKKAATKKILNVHAPLVPEFFDPRMRANGLPALAPLALFKRGPAMASVTLHETMLDERRLEAVLKMTRKKRC